MGGFCLRICRLDRALDIPLTTTFAFSQIHCLNTQAEGSSTYLAVVLPTGLSRQHQKVMRSFENDHRSRRDTRAPEDIAFEI
jgi:hypothetical protein